MIDSTISIHYCIPIPINKFVQRGLPNDVVAVGIIRFWVETSNSPCPVVST